MRTEMNNLPTVTVSARSLAAAAPFMAKKDIRHYLNGLLLEAHKDGSVNVVATDGHALLAANDKRSKWEPGRQAVIPRSMVDAIVKATKDEDVELDFNGSTVTARWGNTQITEFCPDLNSRFPDYRAVLPLEGDGTAKPVGVLDYTLVERVVKASANLKKCGSFGSKRAIHFHGYGLNDSVGFVIRPVWSAQEAEDSGLTVLGVAMPMRNTGSNFHAHRTMLG